MAEHGRQLAGRPANGRNDLVGVSSGQEPCVYLYQVSNTNRLGGNQNLENSNITFGSPGTANPFITGGYFRDKSFASVSNAIAPLDTPNDGGALSRRTRGPVREKGASRA